MAALAAIEDCVGGATVTQPYLVFGDRGQVLRTGFVSDRDVERESPGSGCTRFVHCGGVFGVGTRSLQVEGTVGMGSVSSAQVSCTVCGARLALSEGS